MGVHLGMWAGNAGGQCGHFGARVCVGHMGGHFGAQVSIQARRLVFL